MAAMASSPPTILGPQPTFVPYEPTRDCSQGLCSMYCPQWCYFIFPPPPPAFDLASPGADDSSGPAFSPLVIAIIGVLASAFLLVSYYTIISKYCGTFSSLRRRVLGSSAAAAAGSGGEGGHGGSRSQEPWSVSASDGLDETLINKITVCKYTRGGGFVDSTDCSVCLGEFRDGESLRLLPKCSHAFHVPCIDTWLKSHSNCPLCRCNIAFVAVGMGSSSPSPEGGRRVDSHELVLTVGDHSPEHVRAGPQNAARGNSGGDQEANGIVEIKEDGGAPPVRASSSSLSDTHREGRMSIADVLQASLEDELIVARESGLLADATGSSRRCHGEHSKGGGGGGRSLPDAASLAPTKRLAPPVGRSCFSSKSGRGKDSVLPM